MPSISSFYGIKITMYWREGHHGRPHFHAEYAEHEAAFDLTGELIAGAIPQRQLRLIQAWVELHSEELGVDWDLAVKGKPLAPIDPLR